MKIVVAMDSFKGSLSARSACEAVAGGLLSVDSELRVVLKPMADGGEGTAGAMMAARAGQWVSVAVTGPLAEMKIEAGFAYFNDSNEALVEMASASGLELLKSHQMNPLKTTTYGTGQLIKAAAEHGARRIMLAVGGSATVDGGVGAAMGLGWQFLDVNGKPIGFGGGQLELIKKIIPPAQLNLPPVEVLCDVDNPLCGEHGAANEFSPQKGASGDMVVRLECVLKHLALIVKEQLGLEIETIPGGGAAGGLAAGAIAFMDAKLVGGIETVMQVSGLPREIADADWIITGEGRFDEQSLRGKVVSGIVSAASVTNARVAVIAGSVEIAKEKSQEFGIETAIAIRQKDMSLDYAIANCQRLLREAAVRFANDHLMS